jgi:hypothetical protein
MSGTSEGTRVDVEAIEARYRSVLARTEHADVDPKYLSDLRDVVALCARVRELEAGNATMRQRISGYESWERSVTEALNSGDGSYRP